LFSKTPHVQAAPFFEVRILAVELLPACFVAKNLMICHGKEPSVAIATGANAGDVARGTLR
jgi:hypothetical protein